MTEQSDNQSWPTAEDGMAPVGVAARDAGTLCQDCGLCCNGSLFPQVSIDHMEARKLKTIGMAVTIMPNGEARFPQPCSFNKGTICSRFSLRPSACRVYYCKIARAVMTGEETLAPASEIVALARRQIDWLRPRLEAIAPPSAEPRGFAALTEQAFHRLDAKRRQGESDEGDRHLAEKMFEHLVLIDRHFNQTTLLNKVGYLLQGLMADAD